MRTDVVNGGVFPADIEDRDNCAINGVRASLPLGNLAHLGHRHVVRHASRTLPLNDPPLRRRFRCTRRPYQDIVVAETLIVRRLSRSDVVEERS